MALGVLLSGPRLVFLPADGVSLEFDPPSKLPSFSSLDLTLPPDRASMSLTVAGDQHALRSRKPTDALTKNEQSAIARSLEATVHNTPPRQVRDLLIRFLAHRMQEQAHGGLSPATRKRLKELARKFETNPND